MKRDQGGRKERELDFQMQGDFTLHRSSSLESSAILCVAGMAAVVDEATGGRCCRRDRGWVSRV